MSEIQSLDVRIPAEIIHNWGWFLAFGIGLALLGILAIVRAVTATVVSLLFFGWLLVIAAGIEIVQAIMVGKWAGLFQHWLGRRPVRGDRCADPVAAAGHRRDFDLADGSVLSGGRPVPIDHSVRDFPAGLGLAHSQRSHHVVARYPRPGAMAGLGALGHRPIRRNRIGLLRRRLDRAGTRPALVGLVRASAQIRAKLLLREFCACSAPVRPA